MVSGDVLGLLLDVDKQRVVFSLNGNSLKDHTLLFTKAKYVTSSCVEYNDGYSQHEWYRCSSNYLRPCDCLFKPAFMIVLHLFDSCTAKNSNSEQEAQV